MFSLGDLERDWRVKSWESEREGRTASQIPQTLNVFLLLSLLEKLSSSHLLLIFVSLSQVLHLRDTQGDPDYSRRCLSAGLQFQILHSFCCYALYLSCTLSCWQHRTSLEGLKRETKGTKIPYGHKREKYKRATGERERGKCPFPTRHAVWCKQNTPFPHSFPLPLTIRTCPESAIRCTCHTEEGKGKRGSHIPDIPP